MVIQLKELNKKLELETGLKEATEKLLG